MNWYVAVLKNYARFSGRARRKEFWMFALWSSVILLVLSAIENRTLDRELLSSVYTLITFIPTLAVTTRRLHDTGHSGWYVLLSVVPLVGLVILIVFTASDGDSGANRYGADPKAPYAQDGYAYSG